MIDHPALFPIREAWWAYRRCPVCLCATRVTHSHTYAVRRQAWVKIGATNNPRRRLSEIARPAGEAHLLSPPEMDWTAPLTTLVVLEGDVEHALHRTFGPLHVVGEWFRADPSLLRWLDAS